MTVFEDLAQAVTDGANKKYNSIIHLAQAVTVTGIFKKKKEKNRLYTWRMLTHVKTVTDGTGRKK